MRDRITSNIVFAIDEFPYLVSRSPELPSVIQKIIDQGLTCHLVLSGSSQRMMQGLVLDATAPLYGRCDEVMNIRPLAPGWIADALKTDPIESVEAYSVWGGVPRYWELARDRQDLKTAMEALVFDYEGVLHREPYRLMLDDLRSASLPYSVLSLIAGGSHRLSEIGARLAKPAVHLARTLEHLVELGFIEREYPFGESIKSTKRTLYKCIDPFLLFWFRFVYPNLSLLERGLVGPVMRECSKLMTGHVSVVWERLARESTAFLPIGGIEWKPGRRWWGKTKDGALMEIDVVAESFDGKAILLGEAKWERNTSLREVWKNLEKAADNLPFLDKKKNVVFAAWLKKPSDTVEQGCFVVDAGAVMKALR
jgi:AAA+ ATPase superfamily predicted ATPase